MSLQPNAYPILEHDPTRRALLEPQELVPRMDLPERCVLSFFGDQVRRLAEAGHARQVPRYTSKAFPGDRSRRDEELAWQRMQVPERFDRYVYEGD